MRKGRELLSLPVVVALTGEQLGEVRELLYDTRECRLIGFVVADGGWLHGAKVVLMPEVREITGTAVVVEDRACVRDLSEIRELKTAICDINGYNLITTDGSELGTIRDLLISPDKGKIEGYEISKGIIDDLLNGRSTVTVSGQVDIVGEQVVVNITKGEGNQ